MRQIVPGIKLAFSLALLSTAPAFTQTPTPHATPGAASVAPVAHVYVQTTKGVNVYGANAAGQLTLVKGSPFADTGQMEGNNGGYLISVGTDYLHSYKIESDGAVGSQASEINTQSYDGSECGNTDASGAIFDHTGHDFYVQLYGAPGSGGVYAACAAWQTYRVETDGAFTFLASIEYDGAADHDATASSVPTISSNDGFGYGVFPEFSGFSYTELSTFTRISSGALEVNSSFTENVPPTNPSLTNGPWQYFPEFVQADPASHLAVVLVNQSFAGCCGYYGAQQLASYTINNTGSISTTNTWQNMPTVEISTIKTTDMSPSGRILAVAGDPGLQLFHFNGAAPATSYGSVLLPSVAIDQLAWDNSNHLYALSYSTGELYVYTVTPTSISEASGSPYKVENAYGVKGLLVVP
ncbi:MAG TPA: hypothetical protein VGG56_07490 [Terracidiphilus sp.]|jgi:hypothetical protein